MQFNTSGNSVLLSARLLKMFSPARSNSSFLHIKLKWTCKFADAPSGAIKTCGAPAESRPSLRWSPSSLARSLPPLSSFAHNWKLSAGNIIVSL